MKKTLTRVAVRLPDQQIQYLRAQADKLGITVSELLRRLIDEDRARQARKDSKR
jgi:predicted DNA binding CopG/RHH family protein